MRTMKGPGIFLSQFIGGEAPFNTLDGLAGWMGGGEGLQSGADPLQPSAYL